MSEQLTNGGTSSSPQLSEVPSGLLSTSSNDAAKQLLEHLAQGSMNGIMQKDNLKYIYKLLEQMKTTGCNSTNNPNYKLLNDFLKQQLVLISTIQQKRKQMTPNLTTIQSTMIQSTLTMNGNNVEDANEFERSRKRPRTSISSSTPTPVPPPSTTPTPLSIWRQDMKDRLKAQIFCFKNHIVKREIPPTCLLSAVRGENVAENLRQYQEFTMTLKQSAPHAFSQISLYQQSPSPVVQQTPIPPHLVSQMMPQGHPQQTIIQHPQQQMMIPMHLQQIRSPSIDSNPGTGILEKDLQPPTQNEDQNDTDLTDDQIQLVMSQLHAKTRPHLLSIIEQCLRSTKSQQITLMAIAKSQQAEETKVNSLLEKIDVAAVEGMLTHSYQKIKVMSESNWEDSYEEQTELIGQICDQLQIPLNAAMELIVEMKKTQYELVFHLFETIIVKLNEMSQINTNMNTDTEFEYYVWKDWKGKKPEETGLRNQIISYWYTCLKHAREARWNKEEMRIWLDKLVHCDKTKVLKRSSSSSKSS